MADIDGTSGDDVLTGTGGPDTLRGLAGNDVLIGGADGDRLEGGTGDDTYHVDDANDIVVEAADEGFDAVFASISYVLRAGVRVELLSTADSAATTAISLTGNELANILYGNAGANVLVGGGGGDSLHGLVGDDTYYLDDAQSVVFESAGNGFDVIFSSVSYALGGGAHVELLSAIDSSATAPLSFVGNELANILYGNAGVNVLVGGGGGDVLHGLAGDDTYYLYDAQSVAYESQGNGFDVIYSSVSYSLGAGVHVELISAIDSAGTAALNFVGNELANVVYGNAGVNVLVGGGGGDSLHGLAGDDTYYVYDAQSVAYEFAGNGFDVIYSSVSYALGAGVHVELISAIDSAGTAALTFVGNELANIIYGNAGVNVLVGGGGGDTLHGLGGDDIYYVDDAANVVIEGAGDGTDTLFASVSYTLGAGAQIETLSALFGSTTAIDLTGNELSNFIRGNAGTNVLDGKSGADILTGLGGADMFAFTTALGAGNVDTITDFVAGQDKLLLAGAPGGPFAALAGGNLRVGTLVIGAAAADADDYLIYNSATGALLYDADGNGAAAAVQFATLSSDLALGVADFLVTGPASTAPVLISATEVSVQENIPTSTIVYQATANDAEGDRITYSLSGTDAPLFSIDANGAVRFLSSPDFETRTTYNFTVLASDSGLSGTRGVTLTVTDVTEASTPIINEMLASNDATSQAQLIDRGGLLVANNPNLDDDDLPSATIQGSVSTATDKDFFSITLQAGERLTLDVDGTAGGLDPHIRVYGSNGVEIGDNDDLVSFDPGSVPTIAQHNTDSFLTFRAPTAGTYYFSIEAFSALSTGAYQLHVSIGPPATPAQRIQEDIEALISGAEWPAGAITYSFPDSPTDYPAGFGDPEEPEVPSFAPFTPVQQAVVHSLLQHISTMTALTFQQLTGAQDRNAKLRYAMTDATEAAHAYYPGNSDEAGSSWFNKDDFNNPRKGNYAWMGILHETGHALGLKHGHELPAIQPDRDSVEFSVMTYRSYPGDPLSGGYSNETWGYPQTLMMYDMAALQQIYGANYNFNATDSIYRWSPTTGEMSINGVGQSAPGANRIFMTAWDGGGNDTYDFSNYNTHVEIDLRPGQWTKISQAQLANLGDGHFARGNIANALLYENDPRSLIENVIGTVEGDTIFANQAANRIIGGGGGDWFRFESLADSRVGAADTITDFVSGGDDRILLMGIDARAGTEMNDAFSYVGTAAFSGAGGELRYEVIGTNAHVFGDVNGDAIADLEIVLLNVTSLVHTDFFF